MDDLDAPIFLLWGTDDWLATGFFGPQNRTITDWDPPSGPHAAGAIIRADHTNPFSRDGLYTVAWNDYTLACYAPAIPAFVATSENRAEIEDNSGWNHVDLQGLSAACWLTHSPTRGNAASFHHPEGNGIRGRTPTIRATSDGSDGL
jgi:hypothetical protein